MLSGFETKNPGNNVQINDNYRNLVLRQTGIINLNSRQQSGAYGEVNGYYYADISYPNPVTPVIAILSKVSTFLVWGLTSGSTKSYRVGHAFFATDQTPYPQGIRYFIFDVPRQQDLPNPDAGIVIKNAGDQVAFTSSPSARYMKVLGILQNNDFDPVSIKTFPFVGDVKVAVCPIVQAVEWTYERYDTPVGGGWVRFTYCSMGSCPTDKIVRIEISDCMMSGATAAGRQRRPYPISLVLDVSGIV